MSDTIVGSENQGASMSPKYQDVMRNFQDANDGDELIDPEKLETSLAVKVCSDSELQRQKGETARSLLMMRSCFHSMQGAVVAQQHALDAQILQHFYMHMRSLSRIHDADISKLQLSLATLSNQIDNIPRPTADIVHPQPAIIKDPPTGTQIDPSMVRLRSQSSDCD